MAAHSAQGVPDPHPTAEQQLVDQEEVQRLLSSLQGAEADIVRMYHLEGKSYQEISLVVGVPENSIGPVLSRARARCAAPESTRRRANALPPHAFLQAADRAARRVCCCAAGRVLK